MTDQEMLVVILTRAGICFNVDSGYGWPRRIVVPGDRAFCFAADGSLERIRDHDDNESFEKW